MQEMLVLLFPSHMHPPLAPNGLGCSQNTQPRGHLVIHFPPHRSSGEAYPGVCLGSAWCRAQPRSLGTQGSVSRLHGSPCPSVGLYHLVLEDTTVLFYLPHKPPFSPLKGSKGQLYAFLGKPTPQLAGLVSECLVVAVASCKLVSGLPLGGNESLPGPAWLCTVRCPSRYPPSWHSLDSPIVLLLRPVAAPGEAGGVTLEQYEGI